MSRRLLSGAVGLERVRTLLVETAARDRAGPLAVGLARFESWEALGALADTAWLPLARRRPTAAALRAARRSMRFFGSAPVGLAAAVSADTGTAVHVRGTCARLPGTAGGAALWESQVIEDRSGRWLVQEAQDFLLTDAGGGSAIVLVEEGQLVSGGRLRVGDEASVFGFLDAVPDQVGLARPPHGRGASALALRSGRQHPLLVSVIRRYA